MSIFDLFKTLDHAKKDAIAFPPEFIICGLGNPGSNYENTRHNAGFMAVDTLAERHNTKIKRLKFKSLTETAVILGVKCFIMKPSTFMNKSGEALTEAMRFYKIPPQKTLIIFDDISGEIGNIRIRRSGSDGGHNGM
ncbi:MAG: aminoacyl-tRNA hydrolase, partial [Eubacterium sp.]|nr:aminoacyl-tRNA hydrolase [Eubacterium sp.]